MLQKVTRHGFEFWEAPRNAGPVFEDIDPEYQQQRERMRLRRMKLEELVKIVAVALGSQTIEDSPLTSDSSPSRARKTTDQDRGKYRKRAENPNDPEIWGDLVQFSDEEPVDILQQLGIPAELKPEDSEPDMADIQDEAMRIFNVTQQEFFEQNRREEVALCRMASMALCRAHTSRTTDEIGEAHGRDHAAVCRAVKRVNALRTSDEEFEHKVTQIEARLLPMAMAA